MLSICGISFSHRGIIYEFLPLHCSRDQFTSRFSPVLDHDKHGGLENCQTAEIVTGRSEDSTVFGVWGGYDALFDGNVLFGSPLAGMRLLRYCALRTRVLER